MLANKLLCSYFRVGCNIMDAQTFQNFADNYTYADFEKIKFVWNGEYGDQFQDNNYDFLIQLCEFLIPQLDRARLELIRDLYLETDKSFEATFGVYVNFHLLAQQLLQRGGTDHLIDYIKGASHTMDIEKLDNFIKILKW